MLIAATKDAHREKFIKLLSLVPKLSIHEWRKIYTAYNEDCDTFLVRLSCLLCSETSSKKIFEVINFLIVLILIYSVYA